MNLKFLHRRISSNNLKKKNIGVAGSEKCTFCERKTEKWAHLFWGFPEPQMFWTSLKVWLESKV